MNRRSFLTGIATSLLAGTAAPRLIGFDAPAAFNLTAAAIVNRALAQVGAINRDLGAFGNASWIEHGDGSIEHVPIAQVIRAVQAGRMAAQAGIAHCCTARGNDVP